MNILGVRLGHDSSAALIVDGKIIADVQEERFTRIKHCAGIPFQSINYCLESNGLTIEDIDVLALPSRFHDQELSFLFQIEDQSNQGSFLRTIKNWLRNLILSRDGSFALPNYYKKHPLPKSAKVVYVEHHLAHAASAYYTSGTAERQLIVTMDGVGDGISTGIWLGEHGKITPLRKWGRSSSLATFYSNVTEAIGWIHGDGEGKTMGLAPYGDPSRARKQLKPYHPHFKDGELVRPYDFGNSGVLYQNGSYQYHFDDADLFKEMVKTYGREDMAAAAQDIVEEQCFHLIYPWLENLGTKKLSCAGGLFLNVKLNQRIWESGKVDLQHIYPNPGDSGLSVGAALYAYYALHPEAPIERIEHLYRGPEFSNEEIKAILELRNLPYQYYPSIEAETAKRLAEGKIVGWLQGPMEAGPRSLGNRSILMSPIDPDAKTVINARVKFREGFRPFCPSLLWERRADYLVNFRDEPFMITSFTCHEEKRNKIPAVVHQDQTMRPQTVKKEVNPRYWNLINEFGKLTGEYILLNTSFNVMGEPIVLHPRDAIRCFYDNGLDVLVLGNFMIEKNA